MLYAKFENNINQLLVFSAFRDCAVAVSGGADSVALLLLMSRWAKENGSKLTVVTINHNLRKEAAQECDYVQSLSNSLGHRCFILSWDHRNNFANLQARAREGRYQLMTSLCNELDVLNLATAHHQDDYIENFWIRQERKSATLGLSSNNHQFFNNVRVIRPLINIHKCELVDFLTTNNIQWFEDSSNLSSQYQRARIRIKLEHNEQLKHNIMFQQLVINKQAHNLKADLIAFIAESVNIYNLGFALIDLAKLKTACAQVRFQLINFVLTIISGKLKMPRASSTEILCDCISAKQEIFIKTLHGCVIKKLQNSLLIYREFGKNLPPNVTLRHVEQCWDNRFQFRATESGLFGAYVTYLTMKDYAIIKDEIKMGKLKEISDNNHLEILFTLPVIKILKKVIALPHLCYYNDDNLRGKLNFSFSPGFISRFTHFC